MRRILFLALLLAAPSAVLAQDPNLQRGFAPGKVYDMLGLDSINAFNGNLNVRIPLGQKYTVGPVLQYQFVLAYNSKIWEFEYVQNDGPADQPRKLPVPDTQSNAGLGWRLTLGELFPPKSEQIGMPPTQGWTYVAPDGSSHEFPNNSPKGPSTTISSQDGSFLRLRPVYEGFTILYEIDFPDGTTHRFKGRNVIRMTDKYGNWVTIDPTTDPNAWKVKDGYGSTTSREHTIVLADAINAEGQPYNQKNFQKRPVALKLAAFDSTVPATYTFTYTDVSLPVGICAGNGIPLEDALVPMLQSVGLPDGTSYVPSYQMEEIGRCTSGVLKELTLPTLGKIAWQHGLYEMAFPECIPASEGDTDVGWIGSYAGVRLRTLKDKDSRPIETRIYTPVLPLRPPEEYECGANPPTTVRLPPPPEELRTTITVSVTDGSGQKLIEKTLSHFSLFPKMANPKFTQFARGIEYGLPFTRRVAENGRFLSSETHGCTGGRCDGPVVRTSYLQYAYETGSDFNGHLRPLNPRVTATRTVFNGDSCGVNCGDHYTDTEHGEYDGYGHFRKTVIDGTLGGAKRTVRTEYQPDTANWLLNIYSATSVIEGTETTQRTTYTFDGAGLLRSRRTLKGTAPGAGDLLAVTCRDARGFVASEKFFGGDWDADGPPPDDADLCTAPVSTKEYEIVHEYPPGEGFRTWHRARYKDQSFYIADETLDANTGLVSATRDSTGLLATSYDYDGMGRLTSVTPPGAASTTFVYRNASSSDPARVTSTTGDSTIIEQTYDYDDVGRLFREKRRMPDGSWALRKTDYRGAPATTFTSEWVRLESGANETLVSPTIGTTFERDQFGRVTKVKTPDQKELSTVYQNGGVREVRKTRKLALAPSGTDTGVTVTETYDLHGQLASVSEPAGPTTAGAPTGGTVLTEYTYDTRGKLSTVEMTGPDGTQRRSFDYDSRGLLESESHPEKDLPTTYGSFDARGHAWTSTDADATFHYEYDSAERLTKISNATGAVLKEFKFGSQTDCTYCKGRLLKAIRHNDVAGVDHQVTETYTYGGNGLPSSRETLVQRGPTEIRKFTQNFDYDEFLALDDVDYPVCGPGCSTTGGLTSVGQTRTRGLLTRVDGFANVSYHPSGMVHEVKRETTPAMTDTYDADTSMARPSKITFTGALACTIPGTPEIALASYVCGGSAGNQASVSNAQNGVTYEWNIQNGTPATATGQSVSFTAGGSGQVTVTVTAKNDCGTAASLPKTAVIPQAIVSGSKTINAGASTPLSVALTGTPDWSLTWSDNNTPSTGIAGSPFTRHVSPNVTTTYQLVMATDATLCNLVRSGSATITVIPPAPGWITAQATDRSVRVEWQKVTLIPNAKYEVERAEKLSGPWAKVGSPTDQLSLTDTPPAGAGGLRVAYVYRVHTIAPDGTRSADSASPRDYAVTATAMYPSGAITAKETFVKAQHVVELRRAIDALRKLVNQPETFASQPDPAGWVTASHFTALLGPLDQARAVFGHGSFVYSGVPRPALGLMIKAEHVTQLREVLK